MNKYVKIMGVMALGLLVANCSGTNYKIKTEKSKVLNEVPKWYVDDFSQKKACGTTTFGKNKNKMSAGRVISLSFFRSLCNVLMTFCSYFAALWPAGEI